MFTIKLEVNGRVVGRVDAVRISDPGIKDFAGKACTYEYTGHWVDASTRQIRRQLGPVIVGIPRVDNPAIFARELLNAFLESEEKDLE